MIIEVGGHYNLRAHGPNGVVHITRVIYGGEATPPVPDEYNGWIEPELPWDYTCPTHGGWASAWHEDGTSTCNPSFDAVSVYTGPLRVWYNAIGRIQIWNTQRQGYSAMGRLGAENFSESEVG
jgi:hypothetical protein